MGIGAPKSRIKSLFYLALAFKQKTQYDLAIEQLTTALSEVSVMDEIRKDICYELGTIYELMGKQEEAVGYYKQIYQVDIGYRDVAQKIEQAYG